MQRSLPAVLLRLVKGKEREGTDKFFADLVRRSRLKTSLHVDANRTKSSNLAHTGQNLKPMWHQEVTSDLPVTNFTLESKSHAK